MDKHASIYVAGHTGLIGYYLCQSLKEHAYSNLMMYSSKELDLRDKRVVDKFFEIKQPEYVFMVGGVKAGVAEYTDNPVKFFTDNMSMEMNLLSAAHRNKVKKLVIAGASCVYPESNDKIISEMHFAEGWVQKATEPYALAKAAGLKLAEYYNIEYGTSFVTALLSNVYGIADKQHSDTTSVIPALVKRFKKAQAEDADTVEIWGDGKNKREFLHAKDCAEALIKIMESDINTGWINVGTGAMVSIDELAAIIAEAINYKGTIVHDLTKPNGSRRSALDISKLEQLGWQATIGLKDGINELIKIGCR